MTTRASGARTRAHFREAQGVLLVSREPPPPPGRIPGYPTMVGANPAEGPEILVAVWDDGSVTALNGHVDLGTGIRTALGQVVAEELDVPFAAVHVVLGHTASAPNQGATIASSTLQIHAAPLRDAAALARGWLRAAAAQRFRCAEAAVTLRDGIAARADAAAPGIPLGELVAGQHVELFLSGPVTVKAPADYSVVGTSVPRVDMAAKALGEAVFVHDVRVPQMLHGRVIRPPYAGLDVGAFVGHCLESFERDSIAHIDGIVEVVRIHDFLGVVAEREEDAQRAVHELVVHWRAFTPRSDLADVAGAVRANPSTRRELKVRGDVDAALAGAAQRLTRTYLWPYQMHASIGPSCAVADWRDGSLTVWSGTQNPHVLRAELATLMGLPDVAVDVVRLEAAGCYGRNCADDVTADAALLSRAVGRPVRVQLTREQEHAWDPKGSAQLMEIDGGLDAQGAAIAYDYRSSQPSNGAPTLALLLTRTIDPVPDVFHTGDRTAVPPYEYPNLRVAVHDMPPILRSAWIRGVSALPNSFAHECYVDELAAAAGVDPIEYRLRLLEDERAIDLVRATAREAGWRPRTQPQEGGADGDVLKGQGFAYARYFHSRFPGFGAAWAAWVAEVEVNRVTGEVHVRRVVVGQDAGTMINPEGVRHQVHGNVIQTTSRSLLESVETTKGEGTVAAREWGAYPILSFRHVPVIETVLLPRPGEPALGVGESASVPGTAAIANAIYDATGVRLRNPPFTPEVVRAALGATAPTVPPPPLPAPPAVPSAAPGWRRKGLAALAGSALLGALAVATSLVLPRPAMLPAGAAGGDFGAPLIERGRLVAASGNCMGCHTTADGAAYAGGRALDTPFGTIYTTNITPDRETGIGAWSLPAFVRAMREGVSRDGHRLYPAFPYPSFTLMSDDDLLALYAYLMALPPVRAQAPTTQLAFPYGARSLMGLWNALYVAPGPYVADPARSAQWNRGAYLVEGAGHCGACHTPRGALGAEDRGGRYLAGAFVEGWEAPSLVGGGAGPVPWTEAQLYAYLREGSSREHGAAVGPMAEVVGALRALPDADIAAMAHYLASLGPGLDDAEAAALAQRAVDASRARDATMRDGAQRMFEASCGGCHHDGAHPAIHGANLPLALNSSLHSAHPDNLVRVILEGVATPAEGVGGMPAFADSLSDDQIARLAAYMRQRFAPGAPAWAEVVAAVKRVRLAAARP